jgi:DNA-binding winged helix-turn-helix (wHTH) protein
LDRTKKVVYEKNIGLVDFKHRFVLLDILFMLAENPGRYYNKEDLAKYIWQNDYNPLVHDKLIYTSISRLRRLIEPSLKHSYILRGKEGYAFNQLAKIKFFVEDKYLHDVPPVLC